MAQTILNLFPDAISQYGLIGCTVSLLMLLIGLSLACLVFLSAMTEKGN